MLHSRRMEGFSGAQPIQFHDIKSVLEIEEVDRSDWQEVISLIIAIDNKAMESWSKKPGSGSA